MRALYLDADGVRYRTDLASPPDAPGEVRVRVLAAGVCATDLALERGYMGFRGIPGHEFVGVALAGPLAGRRVVGEINAACGRCDTCRAGRPRHCPRRDVLGILGRSGAFAEELCLPAANLHVVPDGVCSAAATFTEPLAAAFEITEQVDLSTAPRSLVVGDGRLGLLCAAVLVRAGCDVTLLGRHAERATLLGGGFRHVTRLAGGRGGGASARAGFDLVVEATGDPRVVQQALGWVRPAGTVVLKTTAARPAELDLAPLVVNEVRLVGSRCGPFAPALAALREAGFADQLAALVDAHYPLAEGAAALARAAEPGVLKVIIDVTE